MIGGWLSLVACRPDGGTIVVDPPVGALSGYYPVSIDLTDAGLDPVEVAEITVGGIRAFDVSVEGDTLTAMVQGAPRSGPQTVRLVTPDGEHVFDDAFAYDPPHDPRFARVVAIGASLTQGVQGGVPTKHGSLHSPPIVLARQLGAYMPSPILVEPLFPSIGWEEVGPPPDCSVPDVVSHVASAALEVLSVLEDEENDTLAFWKARVDPDLEIHNLGVGDTNLSALVDGPPDDLAELFVVKMVYAPYADVLEKVTTSQLELAEALEPTVVVVADTYGNDLIRGIVLSEELDPNELTPPDELRADLEILAARLSATGAEVFLANMPRATLLPITETKRLAWLAAGKDPAEIELRIATFEATGLAYNQILDEVAATFPTVHVVDLYGRVQDIEANGLAVGDDVLTVQKFGGILGTDGVHFSDVGYGLLADLFVDAIGEVMGVPLDAVDLAAIQIGDPYGLDAAREAGVEPGSCL